MPQHAVDDHAADGSCRDEVQHGLGRLFHALTWTMCVIGIGLLFRAGRRVDVTWSGKLLVGSLLGGWGLFNFVEGLIDHQLLGLERG